MRIHEASNSFARKIVRRAIAGEVQGTGHLCGELSSVINGWPPLALRPGYASAPSLTWGSSPQSRAKLEAEPFFMRETQSRVKNSEEFISGADIVVGYRAEADGIAAKKGFLAQSKILTKPLKKGELIRVTENPERFVDECERMLALTSHAYAFIYTTEGVICYPAEWVYHLTSDGAPSGYGVPLARLFYDFLICRIGDEEIYDDTMPGFRRFVEKRKEALQISAVLE